MGCPGARARGSSLAAAGQEAGEVEADLAVRPAQVDLGELAGRGMVTEVVQLLERAHLVLRVHELAALAAAHQHHGDGLGALLLLRAQGSAPASVPAPRASSPRAPCARRRTPRGERAGAAGA